MALGSGTNMGGAVGGRNGREQGPGARDQERRDRSLVPRPYSHRTFTILPRGPTIHPARPAKPTPQ